jgi:hypothetical protein
MPNLETNAPCWSTTDGNVRAFANSLLLRAERHLAGDGPIGWLSKAMLRRDMHRYFRENPFEIAAVVPKLPFPHVVVDPPTHNMGTFLEVEIPSPTISIDTDHGKLSALVCATATKKGFRLFAKFKREPNDGASRTNMIEICTRIPFSEVPGFLSRA